MVGTALAAAASLSTCAPIPGAERLWDSRAVRFVMVGEMHGTREAPELFADLVCAAAKSHPVVVALEQDATEQPAIDAFLRSSGDGTSRSEFLKAPIWNPSLRDGRSSKAMLGLFDQLRQWKQEGRIAGVVAFRPILEFVPGADVNELNNRGMAEVLKLIAAADPKALVLAYGGSSHMSLSDVTPGVHSAAARLPREQTRTVFVEGTGFAWNCVGGQCGSHPQNGLTQICRSRGREVQFPPIHAAMLEFDAIACVGKPFTASPPALPLPTK